MNKLSSLSIFFPTFNEESNISNVISQVLKIAPNISQKYEIIVIDDGSTDGTAKVVWDLIEKNNNIRLVKHKSNLGYGAALKSGFYESKHDYITYMDSDGQFDFSEIYKLLGKIDKADIVAGFRIKRADNALRVLNGHLWNILVYLVLGLEFHDIDCGFKLIKKKVIDNIPKLESNGATISAELFVKAQKQGYKITQVGLNHKPRQFGTATGGNPLHIIRAFVDLLKVVPKI